MNAAEAETTDFFAGCNSKEERKKRYKELAKQYHPDLGGDTKVMSEINSQYDGKPPKKKSTGPIYDHFDNDTFGGKFHRYAREDPAEAFRKAREYAERMRREHERQRQEQEEYIKRGYKEGKYRGFRTDSQPFGEHSSMNWEDVLNEFRKQEEAQRKRREQHRAEAERKAEAERQAKAERHRQINAGKIGKPCPWCASNNLKVMFSQAKGVYRIQCGDCQAAGPLTTVEESARNNYGKFTTWNNRIRGKQ